jgi:plasmid maintenance system antidote protein VapI
MNLQQYIEKKYNNSQTKLADHLGLHRQQVSRWTQQDSVVVNDVLYIKKRDLK